MRIFVLCVALMLSLCLGPNIVYSQEGGDRDTGNSGTDRDSDNDVWDYNLGIDRNTADYGREDSSSYIDRDAGSEEMWDYDKDDIVQDSDNDDKAWDYDENDIIQDSDKDYKVWEYPSDS